ncbi:hypothetical protein PISMIDRAFT_670989 [Pisolithus microcarpus 441]|uniref:Unplaced genomic scaffold scaffold_2, whole genome shotgun sequence n=1 Tax=Pisolithus microcarpus 441 TaxID=765257 RepID=A0A0C9ZN37_9AGAM|nr:hypothetical protein PISMIDRAFT_670989 [Pisolithus microcarpus 441]
MYSAIHSPMPSDAELANQALADETSYRFPSFTANDAVTLGLSIRKRFRGSSRHARGKGMVISIQSIAGHTLFACTAGDLGHPSGTGDVSLDSWACLQGMIDIVKRTSHSSYYIEKAMNAMGKTAKQMGLEIGIAICGGAFPIWLENAPCCPIVVAACYSGSSQDDHKLLVTTVRDYLHKMRGEPGTSRLSLSSFAPTEMPIPTVANPELREEGSSEQYIGDARYIQRRENIHEETIHRRSSFDTTE